METYLYMAVCLCLSVGCRNCMSEQYLDHHVTEYVVNIGVLAECKAMSHGCGKQIETAYFDNITVIFNLHWISIVSSEIYVTTQAIERTRGSMDFYLVLTVASPISQTLSVLQGLGIPYMRMCVLISADYQQTICLPKYGINPHLQQNILSPEEATPNTADKALRFSGKTCEAPLIPYQKDEDKGNDCNRSDIHNIEKEQHLSRIVTSIVSTANWESVLLLYESLFEVNIASLFDGFSMFGLVTRGSHMIDRASEAELINIFNQTIVIGKQNSIQIAILCKERCLEILKAMKVYDQQQKTVKAFYYFAEVLLVSMASPETFHQELIDSTFNNIAVVTLPLWLLNENERKRNSTLEHTSVIQHIHKAVDLALCNFTVPDSLPENVLDQMERYQVSLALLSFPVDTLVWDKDGRRLSRVGMIHISGEYRQSGLLFPNKQLGFNGRQLLVSSLAFYPFVENHGNDSYDGLCFDILRQLAKDMNFTYRLTTSPDLEWGVSTDQGRWSGLIGQLQRNEVDLVASALTVLSVREEVMDFTHPFFYDATILLMAKEDPNTKKWRTYIDPFHWILLVSIGTGLIIVSAFTCLLDRISPLRMRMDQPPWTFLNILWYLYGALIGRGGGIFQGTQVTRIVVGSWWIFCVVLIATYTGNLVAFLAVNKDALPFQGVEGMLKQDVYTWGVVGGTSWVTMFQLSSLPVFKAVYEGMVRFNRTDPDVLSPDQEVHINKVLRGNYVHIGDRSQIQVKTANECSLFTGSAEIQPVQYSFGLPNGSPLTDLFSQKIMAMHENGLISFWKRRRWPKRDFCPETLQTYTKVISLADIQSAFYLLGVGLVLAFVSIMFEVTLYVVKVFRKKEEHTIIAS